MSEAPRKSRGTTRVLLGVACVVVVCGAWITVAIGIRTLATTQAQHAADAAALAGAGALLISPRDTARAKAEAIRFAKLNAVVGRAPRVRPADVAIDPDSGSVRVRVHATIYALPNALAWVLGVEEVSVSAVATAEGRAADFERGLPLKMMRLVE